jgi:transketolase
VRRAIEQAYSVTDRPTLICCKTIIGWGSPNQQGKESCHGAALGDDEVALVRQTIDWVHDPFIIPDEIYAGWDARTRGAKLEADWNQRYTDYRGAHPELAAEFERRMERRLPNDWPAVVRAYLDHANTAARKDATRKASQAALNAFAALLPELIGGSADLTGSNNTNWSGSKPLTADAAGNYVYYGVREFAMGAIMNGMVLHGGLIPYGGTFLVFSDYARNALRMAALMKVQSIFVFTHDSIGLGEDGPTHQPVEHAASLRVMPNMMVWRPCDTVETAVSWAAAIERRDGPTSLLLSRQGLAHQSRSPEQLESIARGGYVLVDSDSDPEAIVIATGSEVDIAVKAAQQFGGRVRVVSMPSVECFERQDQDYRDSVLPPAVTRRVAVEAGVSDGWYKYVGMKGRVIGLDRFGESAPAPQVFERFGFTVDNVVRTLNDVLSA